MIKKTSITECNIFRKVKGVSVFRVGVLGFFALRLTYTFPKLSWKVFEFEA